MKIVTNKIIYVFLLLVTPIMLYAQFGVVAKNGILFIKKRPYGESRKLGFYQQNQVIEILDKIEDIETGDFWYQTNKGYVPAEYIVLDNEMPTFVTKKDIDFNKYAVQLAVYKKSSINSFKNIILSLKNEQNVYAQEVKNVYVVYLVNFDDYFKAYSKSIELTDKFPNDFVLKFKSSNLKDHKDVTELLYKDYKKSELKFQSQSTNKQNTQVTNQTKSQSKKHFKRTQIISSDIRDEYLDKDDFDDEYFSDKELKELGIKATEDEKEDLQKRK